MNALYGSVEACLRRGHSGKQLTVANGIDPPYPGGMLQFLKCRIGVFAFQQGFLYALFKIADLTYGVLLPV